MCNSLFALNVVSRVRVGSEKKWLNFYVKIFRYFSSWNFYVWWNIAGRFILCFKNVQLKIQQVSILKVEFDSSWERYEKSPRAVLSHFLWCWAGSFIFSERNFRFKSTQTPPKEREEVKANALARESIKNHSKSMIFLRYILIYLSVEQSRIRTWIVSAVKWSPSR